MSRHRREGQGSGDGGGDLDGRVGILSPGKRTLTAFAPNKRPPLDPGKRTLTQHFAPGENTGNGLGRGGGGQQSPAATGAVPMNASSGTVDHQTEYTAADGGAATRTSIGVGERVFFTADTAGSWTASAGTARGTGQQFTWTAPATVGAVTVTFTPAGGGAPVRTTMTVVAPTEVRLTDPTADTFPRGTMGAGFVANVVFHPLTVSFAATQWKEDTGQTGEGATGYFDDKRLPVHGANPRWLGIGDGNTGPTDHAAFSGFPSPWDREGSFYWSIQSRWKLRSESGSGAPIGAPLIQRGAVEGPPHAGRMTVTKGGASATRSPDGSTTGNSGGRGSGYGDVRAFFDGAHERVGWGVGDGSNAGGKTAAKTSAKDAPEEKYTLPDSVQDFAIEPDGWSALVRTKWVNAAFQERIFQMLQQMQRLGAFPWASEDGLRRTAAKTKQLSEKDEVVRYRVTLRTLAQMGLPPLSGAMAAYEGDKLIVAVKVPGVTKDEAKDVEGDKYMLSFDDASMVYAAASARTKLPLQSHPHLDGLVVRDGIIEVHISDKQATDMFGAKAWNDWKKKRHPTPGNDGGAIDDKPQDVGSELSSSERQRITKWISDNLNIVSGGPVSHVDRTTLNVIDEIDKNPDLKPILQELVRKNLKRPGEAVSTVTLENLLEAAKMERDRHRLGTDKLDPSTAKALDPNDKVWTITGRIVQKGLVFADREMTYQLELDWDQWLAFRPVNDVDEFSKRASHHEIEWGIERVDKPDQPFTAKQIHTTTSGIKLDHTFKLGAGEKSGQFKVHVFMRSSHFAPKQFTTLTEVKTEEARMDELRARDLGDMMPADPMMMNYEFDIGTGQKVLRKVGIGSDRDTHGLATSGKLPKDFQHANARARKKARDAEIELQKKLVKYLRAQLDTGKPGYNDALQAAEQRIKSLQEVEEKLAADQSSGWKQFEVRGTYLSRNADVPTGGLDLYGFFQVSKKLGEPAKFGVKIRDLSNKIESDLEFTGDGEFFDDALREAFIKLAKAYPDGKISILAEDHDFTLGLSGKPNGKAIGYELATTSAWKRVKSKVYDPVVQILVNAAAMAIMIIFPPSAAVIVPMLAVADIVNNVDDMVQKHDKGKLTFQDASIDLLQIGLDVLPAARNAKLLNPAKSAIQEVKGGLNMRLVLFDAVQLGGQFIVMYERTQQQLVEIQEKQISVMAEKYRALIDLEKKVAEHKINPSDPQLVQKRAEIDADAKAIRDTVTLTWTEAVQHQAAFFVGSHLVGGHEEAAAGAKANKDTHFEPAVPHEVTTLRRTAPNKFEAEARSLRVVHAHYEREGARTSAIEYDHASGTAHFEITDKAGTVTRIESPIGRVKSFAELSGAQNKVVGHPIEKSAGLALIEKLNRGDASALKEVGIDPGAGKLPHDHEFGLGELKDNTVVLVVGEPAAVDWSHLPGMIPRAHTHPPGVHDIPDQGGTRSVPLAKLVEPKPDPYIAREVVFPSGADIIVMAHLRVDGHVVVTEFVLRGGMVMKAPAGDTGPRLVFTIHGAQEIGVMPNGRNVYKAKLVGKSGTDTPIAHDVWVIANAHDTNGGLYMTEPPGVILHEPGQPRMPRESTAVTATKTAAEKGVPKAPLTATEITRKQKLLTNWHELGETELRELAGFRERSGDATFEASTPEHKIRAWEEVQKNEHEKDFATWSAAYHQKNRSKISATADPSSSEFGKLVYAVYESRKRNIDQAGFSKSNEAKELFGDLTHMTTADAATLATGYTHALAEIDAIREHGKSVSMGEDELRAFLNQRKRAGLTLAGTKEEMTKWKAHKDSGVPFAFDTQAEFDEFKKTAGEELTRALKKRDPKAEAYLQGSALSGISYERHLPFDHDSDLDVAIVSRPLMKAAEALIDPRDKDKKIGRSPKRIGPLDDGMITELNLDRFVNRLEALAEKAGKQPHEVRIMLFDDVADMQKPIGSSSKESTRPATPLVKRESKKP